MGLETATWVLRKITVLSQTKNKKSLNDRCRLKEYFLKIGMNEEHLLEALRKITVLRQIKNKKSLKRSL